MPSFRRQTSKEYQFVALRPLAFFFTKKYYQQESKRCRQQGEMMLLQSTKSIFKYPWILWFSKEDKKSENGC